MLAALLLAASAGPAAALQAEPPQQETGCGESASLAVTVLDDSGFISIPGSTVVLRWTDAVRRPIREDADGDGRLFLCVPRDAGRATLWAEFGDASSEEESIVLVPGYAHEVELRLLFGEIRTGRLIGRVLDGRTHRPVATAAVSVAERDEAVETNRRGHFVLSGLPVGEHELSVRHLGYEPLTHPVRVTQGVTTEVDVDLTPDPVELAPLVATTSRPRRLEMKGFYERRYWAELSGGGTFITAAEIERRNPLRITHMIAEAPGVKLGGCTLRGHSCKLYSTRSGVGTSSGGCEMTVYLDGHPVVRGSSRFRTSASTRTYSASRPGFQIEGESLNDFVMPVEIAGVEVYKGLASLPAEFGGHANRCGVVLVWTK
ncbi:carboxypeptidase regulatory-like domain-containing protein [Candidatus Palauibacter sp.]|uniref:carboxypeptidase regulatory-like domain-containing protein n=1 Tax=Candidatus Palauibacter sp. TaxID=3101350 RepID=UPI003B02B75F